MPRSKETDITKGFHSHYVVPTTSSQQRQYEQDCADYARANRGSSLNFTQHVDKLNRRTEQWELAYGERIKAYEETETARMERRDRRDPDIRYLRNMKNREENALRRLDHAQRDYRAAVDGNTVDTLNRIQRNRIPETSNYRTPAEIDNYIGRYAETAPPRSLKLPSSREYAVPHDWRRGN